MPVMQPTRTVWVSKDAAGQLKMVRVADMDNEHLARWIQYFRRKYRNAGYTGSDEAIDASIRADVVTAPAIYAEAVKRQVLPSLIQPGAPALDPVPADPKVKMPSLRQKQFEGIIRQALPDGVYLVSVIHSNMTDTLIINVNIARPVISAQALRAVLTPMLAKMSELIWRHPHAVSLSIMGGSTAQTGANSATINAEPGDRLISLDEDEP